MLPNCLTKAFASTARLNSGHLSFCGFTATLYKALLVQGFTGWQSFLNFCAPTSYLVTFLSRIAVQRGLQKWRRKKKIKRLKRLRCLAAACTKTRAGC